MLFGLFASMLLMIVMGKFLMLMWIPFLKSVATLATSGFSITTFIGSTIVFTTLAISIAHRVYGLITEIPDQSLRYVGGIGEQLGESQAEQKAQGMVVGAFSRYESKIGGGGGGKAGAPQDGKKPGANDLISKKNTKGPAANNETSP